MPTGNGYYMAPIGNKPDVYDAGKKSANAATTTQIAFSNVTDKAMGLVVENLSTTSEVSIRLSASTNDDIYITSEKDFSCNMEFTSLFLVNATTTTATVKYVVTGW